MRMRGAIMVAVLAVAATTSAQDWPQRPVRLILPFAAGGTAEDALRFHRGAYEKWGALVRATGAKAE